jgi:triphosphatase
MSEPREVELKLELSAADLAALTPRRMAQLGATGGETQHLTSTYYDTPKGRLRKRGLTLRVRADGDGHVQTVKADGKNGGGLFDRSEWETAVDGDSPDLAAAAETPVGRLLARKHDRSLEAIFQTIVERGVWRIANATSEIELAVDRGEVQAGGAVAPIAELELELKRGEAPALFDLARKLGRSRPLKLGVLAKSERGFALAKASGSGVAKAEPILLTPGMTTAAAFQLIAGSCIRHFRRNEPIVIAERSSGALHQARVALRRLRSALSLFGPVLADARLNRIKLGLREISNELGEGRNLDVYLARAVKPDSDLALHPEGVAVLEAERNRAYDRIIARLNSPRFSRFMLDLAAWIACGRWLTAEAGLQRREQPIEDFAAKVLERRRRQVKKRGRKLSTLSPEERHQVRIGAKKLRYASEFFASTADRPKSRRRHKAFIAALENLQACLGELNDIHTGGQLAVAGLPPPVEPTDPETEAGRLAPLLEQAEKAHRALVKAKPFWR